MVSQTFSRQSSHSDFQSYVEVAEHDDFKATVIAGDITHQFFALASRHRIAVLAVSNINDKLKSINRHCKIETNRCIWSPHSSVNTIALTNNQYVEFYDWNSIDSNFVEHSLSRSLQSLSLSRIVSDIDWSSIDPALFLTASPTDGIVLWDLRLNRRTANLHCVHDASKARFSPFRPYWILSAHEGQIRLWDRRKTSSALYTEFAHSHRTHAIDWSRSVSNKFVTAGQEIRNGSLKLWNVGEYSLIPVSESETRRILHAKFTPEGDDVITTYMPEHIFKNTDSNAHNLVLWNTDASELAQSSTPLVGHTDLIYDFVFCSDNSDSSNLDRQCAFKVLSISKDNTVRKWSVDGVTPPYDLNAGGGGGRGLGSNCGSIELDGAPISDSITHNVPVALFQANGEIVGPQHMGHHSVSFPFLDKVSNRDAIDVLENGKDRPRSKVTPEQVLQYIETRYGPPSPITVLGWLSLRDQTVHVFWTSDEVIKRFMCFGPG